MAHIQINQKELKGIALPEDKVGRHHEEVSAMLSPSRMRITHLMNPNRLQEMTYLWVQVTAIMNVRNQGTYLIEGKVYTPMSCAICS